MLNETLSHPEVKGSKPFLTFFLINKMESKGVVPTIQERELCKCTPTWMKEWMSRCEKDRCAWCDLSFERAPWMASWLYCCSHTPNRVHNYSLLFHNGCEVPFHAQLEETNRINALKHIPWEIEKYPPDALKKVYQDCLREHAHDGASCDNCHVSQQKNFRLKTCTGCKAVKYCSVECSKENWSKHKAFCLRAQEQRKAIPSMPIKVEDVSKVPCSCLPLVPAGYARRLETDLCSYYKCNRVIKDWEVVLTIFVGECGKEAKRLHTIPTHFCSVKCRTEAIKREHE